MKILLVNPIQNQTKLRKNLFLASYNKLLRHIPLNLAQLIALAPKEYDINIVDESQTCEINFNEKYDLVAISTITINAYRAYEIADIFRKKNIPVVLGGYHPSALPHEAKQHADSVVIGEAELTWPKLLKDFESGKMKTFYSQLNPVDPSLIPMAYRGSLKGYLPSNNVQATRGCPNRCEFCAIQKVEGSTLRKRPIENVVEEIKKIESSFFSFYDPSLTNDKEYTKTLFREIECLNKHFVCHGNIDMLTRDEELIKISAKAGCLAWFIGFESISQDSLDSISKKNLVKNYEKGIKKIRKYGIKVKGLFMFGFDNDTKDIFGRTLKAIKEWKIDSADFAILTPYPGTKIYERLDQEGRILTKDWSKYNFYNVVFQPKKMSKEELLQRTMDFIKNYYSLSSTFNRILYKGNLNLAGFKYNMIQNLHDRNLWLSYQKSTS
jgi:radical SAM superfamily enzyme YgiQ (UPF0313 family)